ncbi:MAG: hypothetical protein ACXVRK_01955 [Gaiellaceae bacterium]
MSVRSHATYTKKCGVPFTSTTRLVAYAWAKSVLFGVEPVDVHVLGSLPSLPAVLYVPP